MIFDQTTLKAEHKHSSQHRLEVLSSDKCGCFYCKAIFLPSEIQEWIGEQSTALCPKCSVDSVIGTKSGYPAASNEFLFAMHALWFET